MDAREEMKRWIAVIVQNAGDDDSKAIKADIDMFLDASATLAGILSTKNQSLARNCRPKQPKPPKLAPAKPLEQPNNGTSSSDTRGSEMDAQGAKIQPQGKSPSPNKSQAAASIGLGAKEHKRPKPPRIYPYVLPT